MRERKEQYDNLVVNAVNSYLITTQKLSYNTLISHDRDKHIQQLRDIVFYYLHFELNYHYDEVFAFFKRKTMMSTIIIRRYYQESKTIEYKQLYDSFCSYMKDTKMILMA